MDQTKKVHSKGTTELPNVAPRDVYGAIQYGTMGVVSSLFNKHQPIFKIV